MTPRGEISDQLHTTEERVWRKMQIWGLSGAGERCNSGRR